MTKEGGPTVLNRLMFVSLGFLSLVTVGLLIGGQPWIAAWMIFLGAVNVIAYRSLQKPGDVGPVDDRRLTGVYSHQVLVQLLTVSIAMTVLAVAFVYRSFGYFSDGRSMSGWGCIICALLAGLVGLAGFAVLIALRRLRSGTAGPLAKRWGEWRGYWPIDSGARVIDSNDH